MTVEEFSREFDLLFRNASKAAPNLDEYEKSVYLTHAQLQLIKNYFRPTGNFAGRGFEQSSKRRNDFSKLIRGKTSSRLINSENISKMSNESYSFLIPEDVFIIIQESVYSDDPSICKKSGRIQLLEDMTMINVVPLSYDNYLNRVKDNPFQEPDSQTVYRLDLGYNNNGGSIRVAELISIYKLHTYQFRYIMYPDPIILADFDQLYPNENLTIDGQNTKQTSILSNSMHVEILKEAVALAENDYYNGNLQTRVQLNQRNE